MSRTKIGFYFEKLVYKMVFIMKKLVINLLLYKTGFYFEKTED